jgi:hypothetical protein
MNNFKSLACFALLNFAALLSNSFASSTDSMQLAAVASGKQIHGKGIHNQCLPFALGLAQVFHDQYKVSSVGIVYTWVVPGFPVIVGKHIVVQYTTVEAGITKHWITDNETKYPVQVEGTNPADWISAFNHHGTFTIDRVLQLPLTSMADREYIGGALMGGTLVR